MSTHLGAQACDRPKVQKVSVLVDFDGTIAPDDPTDRIFERFADPSWREVEAAWQRGDSSSRDCLKRQTALLRATPDALDEMVSTIRIDPGFPVFIEFCRRRGVEVKIVSDGFDRVIRAALNCVRLSTLLRQQARVDGRRSVAIGTSSLSEVDAA